MKFRAVVFDLFHTLTGKESEWSDLPWTADTLGIERARWNDLLVVHSRWRLAGEQRDPFKILSRIARHANPAIEDDLIREALRLRTQRFKDCLSRIPQENLVTLKRLREDGYSIGLISNADAMEYAAWCASALPDLFDAAVFSCEVGYAKPERAIYERCFELLGVAGSDCLFVGDGGSNELIGAKEAGMTTTFLSGVMAELWPERVAERIAVSDYHLESIPQVYSLL